MITWWEVFILLTESISSSKVQYRNKLFPNSNDRVRYQQLQQMLNQWVICLSFLGFLKDCTVLSKSQLEVLNCHFHKCKNGFEEFRVWLLLLNQKERAQFLKCHKTKNLWNKQQYLEHILQIIVHSLNWAVLRLFKRTLEFRSSFASNHVLASLQSTNLQSNESFLSQSLQYFKL